MKTIHGRREVKFLFNGRERVAHVVIESMPDDQPFDGDIAEDIEAYERGDFEMRVIYVRASYLGIEESEYLGGVCVAKGPDITDAVDQNSMIQQAIDNLRETLSRVQQALNNE